MKRKLAAALLAALFAVSSAAGAAPAESPGNWSSPTPAQLQKARDSRLSLPQESSPPPPPAGASRHYVNVQFTCCALNPTYNPIGFTVLENTGGSTVTLFYAQGQEKSTVWQTTANIVENPAVQALVLAAVREETGLPAGDFAVAPQSLAAQATLPVAPGETGSILAYHSAVETCGAFTWADVDQNGAIVACGREPFGGAFILSGLYLENAIR